MADPILIAQHGDIQCFILPGLANRHGLITGATGTGKTVTLQKLAESFSQIGVPVFMSDVKGDLTGISQQGTIGGKMADILKERGLPLPEPTSCPVTLWDVFGELGLFRVADFGQALVQIAQHPQQEGGVQTRRLHQLVSAQDVDHALAAHGLHVGVG